jgi:hypothetical protein
MGEKEENKGEKMLFLFEFTKNAQESTKKKT